MAQRIEALTGQLATTAQAAERARRDKQRDDQLVVSCPAAELAAARAAYPALTDRLGADRPQRADDCSAAESSLTADLTRRLERIGRELGGYGQSLVQAMGEVLRKWPELRADLDATVDSRAEFIAFHDRGGT